jgi:DNA-binding response OmpR family regulator
MNLKRILYVEDDIDIQAVARLALELIGGFTVEVFASGQEALDGAADFSPDLILLDVMMPGMDGPTTLQKLREQSSLAKTPVVFLTAKVQPDEMAHFKSLGAVDVIPKPFDPLKLSEQITAIWRDSHGQ